MWNEKLKAFFVPWCLPIKNLFHIFLLWCLDETSANLFFSFVHFSFSCVLICLFRRFSRACKCRLNSRVTLLFHEWRRWVEEKVGTWKSFSWKHFQSNMQITINLFALRFSTTMEDYMAPCFLIRIDMNTQ